MLKLAALRVGLGGLLGIIALAQPIPAETPAEKLDQLIRGSALPEVIHSALGVTRAGTPIPCLFTAEDLDHNTRKTRILLIGGLDGGTRSVKSTLEAVKWFYAASEAQGFREDFALSAVPVANPEGWAAGGVPDNGSGGNPTRGYPPSGQAYSSPADPEAAYLWRSIGMHAPDLLVDLRAGETAAWYIPESADPQLANLPSRLDPSYRMEPSDQLVSQLVRVAPSGTGTVPAIRAHIPAEGGPESLTTLLRTLKETRFRGPSPARRELQRRLARTPLEVARQLANHYGHELNRVVYIPAVALMGRLRLGELTSDRRHLADVERIVAPYVTGQKPTLPARPSSSHLSGHLVFAELAKATGKREYVALARAAADLGFDERGAPKPSMPFHNEMSDSVFMGCPILAQVGQLTGEPRYFDMCLRHMRFMLGLTLRPDGLHRHSPLNEAAWGRGNGFPALGLALSLSHFPENHPGRDEMLQAFRAHLEALLRHQDPTGAWHQVVDVAGSYRELTSTCMITFAMLRGIRSGWLDEGKYAPAVDRAWYAIRTRVGSNGDLVDVCTSTGKQPSLRHYLDRTAILGPDPRGGAMALLAATEMALWQRER